MVRGNLMPGISKASWAIAGFVAIYCCNQEAASLFSPTGDRTHLYKLEIPDVGLNPFEVITGRPMSLPASLDLRKADCHLTRDALLEYYVSLTNAISSASQQLVGVTCQREAMKIQKEPLGSKWEGPFQVLLTTHVAVRVLESDTFSCSQATALHHAVKISSRAYQQFIKAFVRGTLTSLVACTTCYIQMDGCEGVRKEESGSKLQEDLGLLCSNEINGITICSMSCVWREGKSNDCVAEIKGVEYSLLITFQFPASAVPS